MSDSNAIQPTSVQTGAEVAANAGGGNVPATTSGEADKPTFGGLIFGILNYLTLAARFIALAAAAVLLKERLYLLRAAARRNAAFARRVGELCGAAGADRYFVALYLETGQSFEVVAECSGALANAADQMEANARFVKDSHQREYGQIFEVAQASPYAQPKPGFNKVR
ncbi:MULTISPECIES: conjugal transfer protein TraB [unclassified Streptomyces]|uniref:conjugal transfer protein TraB n=1 Tax=unclassified Streptomyces TaxID=2593676 RepID=UPI0036E5008C